MGRRLSHNTAIYGNTIKCILNFIYGRASFGVILAICGKLCSGKNHSKFENKSIFLSILHHFQCCDFFEVILTPTFEIVYGGHFENEIFS